MKDIDLLLEGETLFSHEEVFTPTYLPEEFLHRASQLGELKLSLKPGIRNSQPLNLLLYGPPGTGKTTAVKFIFDQIEKVTNKLLTVYINCEDFSTPYAVLSKIYQKLFNYMPPSTGKPIEEIKDAVFRKLLQLDKSLVVALDELDRLFLEKCADKVIIDLLKAHTTYGYDRVGIIGIMIRADPLAYLDDKARSVFNPARVVFQPYNPKEIKDILSERVKYGFYDGVISDQLLGHVVRTTHQHRSDIRIGLDILKRAALLAEQDADRKISAAHLEKVIGTLAQFQRQGKEKTLSTDEKKLLAIITESENSSSGYLYEIFRQQTAHGIKKYNQLIANLERKGLIKTRYIPGTRGRSRTIIPL